MDAKEAAARILGRRTDIMTRGSLHPVLRDRIQASAAGVLTATFPGRGGTEIIDAVEPINSEMAGTDAPNLRTSKSYYVNCHRNPPITQTVTVIGPERMRPAIAFIA